MSNTAKNLVIILGFITIAFAGYFMFMQQSATTLHFDTSEEVLQNMLSNSQLFIERRRELEAIELDLQFFTDDRLLSLQSVNEPLVEQPVGRENPFEPAEPAEIN